MGQNIDFRTFIEAEFEKAKVKYSKLTLRKFAELIDVSPSTLSRILNGSREASSYIQQKIKRNLNQLCEEHGQEMFRRKYAEGVFERLDDWYFLPILSLTYLKDFDSTPRYIAEKLGISEEKAIEAIKTLLDVGLLKNESGILKKRESHSSSSIDIPSGFLKAAHLRNFDLARKSLFQTPVEKRDVSAMTFPVNSKNLKKAKKLIKEFKDNMTLLVGSGEKDDVYKLCVQLFPVTESHDGKKL